MHITHANTERGLHRPVDIGEEDDEDEDDDSEDDDESDDQPKGAAVKKGPVVVILLVELCERLTYYTLAVTQKTYMQNQLHRRPSSAASVNSVFSMLCYLWCIPGGLLADSIGRYKTIIAAGSVYFIGTVIVGFSVVHEWQRPMAPFFITGSLLLIPLGTGGIKPNIANFGADQIGDHTEEQRKCQKVYFSMFYLSINVGVLGAFAFFANETTTGLPGLVPVVEGYAFAYGAGAICMLVAMTLFIGSTRLYKRLPGSGLGPAKELVRYQFYSTLHGRSVKAALATIGWLCLPLFFITTIVSALMPGPPAEGPKAVFVDPCNPVAAPARVLHGSAGGNGLLNNLSLGFGSIACVFLVVGNVNPTWVIPLRDEHEGFTMEEARKFFAAVPMLVVVNIAFNLSYNAMNNAFPSAACQMNLLFGGTQLNGAFFNLADAIAIVAFTPIFESCLFPCITRMKGSPVRLGQKIVAGILVAAAANLVAAFIEVQRRNAPFLCDENFSKCAPGYVHGPDRHGGPGLQGTRMRAISAFWIFVPFALVGISEILVNPCMYCFSYEAAPPQVRSLMQAVNLFFMGDRKSVV